MRRGAKTQDRRQQCFTEPALIPWPKLVTAAGHHKSTDTELEPAPPEISGSHLQWSQASSTPSTTTGEKQALLRHETRSA